MKINISSLWEQLGVEDEVSILQQLHDVYFGEPSLAVEIIHRKGYQPEQYFQSSSDVCGFREDGTIERLAIKKVVTPLSVDGNNFPYFDKVLGCNIYKGMVDWDEWIKYAGFLHDKEADEPYGMAKQKQFIKEILVELDRYSNEREITISERNLGKFEDHVDLAPVRRGDDSTDHFYHLFKTIKELEKDGFLKIVKVDFDFTALPTPIKEEFSRLYRGIFSDEGVTFYPAEHCKATVELVNSQSSEAVLLKEAEKRTIPAEKIMTAMEEDAEIKPKEKLYQDEMRLVSKLLKTCSPGFSEVELCSPAVLAQTDKFRAGFDDYEVVKFLKKKKVLTKVKDMTYKQTASLLYRVTVDYQNLLRFAEELHDEIEARGELYGFDLQKRSLLKLIREEHEVLPQPQKITVSEIILGTYYPQNFSGNPAGISLIRPDKGRPDIRYQFMRTLRALEKEGHFEIESVNFDFYALPAAIPQTGRIISGDSSEYWREEHNPPKHCEVTLKFVHAVPPTEPNDLALRPTVGERPTGIDSVDSRQGQRADSEQPQAFTYVDRTAKSEADITEWPEAFHWSADGKCYELGDGKEFNFGADKSKRKDIFIDLTEKKGRWSTVRDLAKIVGESENYTRVVVNQLSDKIVSQKLQRYLRIESRGETNKPGACRIHPFPPKINSG